VERIVCLQETKMTKEDANLLQLQIPGCLVISSPCQFDTLEHEPCASNSREEAEHSNLEVGHQPFGGTPGSASSSSGHKTSQPIAPEEHMNCDDHTQSGASGGVAILLPTYLCTTQVTTHELIPGYAIAAAFAMKSFAWCVVSVYLRPKHEKKLLTTLITELKKLVHTHQYDTFLILGDFNQARKLPEWDTLLGVLDLTDLLPFPTNTFHGPNGSSPLDTCLAPSALFDETLWTSKFRKIQRQDSKLGHDCVLFDLRPATGGTCNQCPSYKRLPDEVFKGTSHQRRVLPLLCQLYAPQVSCPAIWLDNMHAFFQAYSRTFPV
jgi:hypothetical protein